MNNLVNRVIKLKIDEIETFNFPLYELIGIEVFYDNIKFEFIAYFTENPNLLCFGTGASPRKSKTSDGKTIKPPYFNRWSWYESFDENFIAYADPIYYIDDEIRIGWYVGDKNNWHLASIAKIILMISHNLQISNNNILFFGSSGGGFSSVVLGTLLRDSKVLINNAQYDVMTYNQKDVKKLFEILHYSFKGYSDEELYNVIKYRLTCIELFKKVKYVPEITCYTNIDSKKDIHGQCLPFIDELLKLPFFKNKFNIYLYQDENGHHPLDSIKTKNIIKNYSNEYLYNGHDNGPEDNVIPIEYNENLVVDISFQNSNYDQIYAIIMYMSFFADWLENDENYNLNVKIRDGNKSVSLKKGFGTVNFSNLIPSSDKFSIYYDSVEYHPNGIVKLIDNLKRATPRLQVIFMAVGASIRVAVKLPKNVSRRAGITIGPLSQFVSLKNGVGFIKFDELKSGLHEVKVQYNGDENYSKVSITKMIKLE